jgi:asparagine synthase (glutamine-hydrolysing)
MCGILGVVSKHAIDRDAFSGALGTLTCRGPDQEGVLFDGRVALGHRRLSIIDLSEAGRQPMRNEDRSLALVYNGEVYNYQALRREIEGAHRWTSQTDTEVLLHGFEEWGQGLVDRIEGMFAFTLWDRRQQRLTLARDHFGKKPLYYYYDPEVFAFASELKALLRLPELRGRLSVDPLSL